MIRIESNGSKWAGQAPDSIEKLLDVMANHPLDRRTFGGHFFTSKPGYSKEFLKDLGVTDVTCFSGNFFDISHVFNIITDEPVLIGKLKKAIRKNQQRPDYKSQ